MSFSFNRSFRQGSWRDFRYFALHQRRDVPARLATIHEELNRIGYVRVLYARRNPDDPNSPMSEARVGIEVQPHTSLGKLVQAYVAQGGNPLDVSLFLSPDSIEYVEGEGSHRDLQPYGGVAYAQSGDPSTPGLQTGGWLPLWAYPPRRTGTTRPYNEEGSEVSRMTHSAKKWISKEIKHLRNNLEAKIVKLCDLREQLLIEANEILPQAVGGSVQGVTFNPETHAISHHLSTITDTIDSVFYPSDGVGGFDFSNPRVSDSTSEWPNLLDDAPDGEEDWTAL